MLISLSSQARFSVETGIFDGRSGYIHVLSVTGLHCFPFEQLVTCIEFTYFGFFLRNASDWDPVE